MPLFGSIPADQNVEVDPVWVQPGAPSTPDSGELWWDTDEPATAYPGQELAYNQITAGVSVTLTSSSNPNLIIEGTSRSYDGSPVIVECYTPIVQAPAAVSQGCVLNLWDAGTDLGIIGEVYNNATSGGIAATVFGRRRLTPTVGTHNYRLVAWVHSGIGTVFAGPGGAGQFMPAHIRVTRV